MSIRSELEKMTQSLEACKQAIVEAGGTLQGDGFQTLGAEIRSTGG